MKRIDEHQPAVCLVRFDAGFQMPIAGPVGLLDLFLGEMKALQIRARQGVQGQRQAGIFFDFLFSHDQSLAGASGQQRHLRMHAQNFQNLFGLRKELRCHKHQPQRRPRSRNCQRRFSAHFCSPFSSNSPAQCAATEYSLLTPQS